MKPQRHNDGERILAVFIDFENLALGFGGRRDRFSIEKVLERLVEKGKIVVKKAYADWSRFGFYTSSLHEAAVELIEIPKRVITGKNSADIRLCVDAMDLAYSKDHIDTFVIVSGDSDFSPLVSKLKELGRDVIGLGLADSTSNLLRDNCDEFLYYEDLDRAPMIPLAEDEAIPEGKRKVFALLLDSLLALRRENKELIFSSMVKDTMKRKKPSFNEEYHGYRTFSELLEDAQRHGILDIEKHKTGGGTYVVTRFGSEPRVTTGGQGALGSGPRATLVVMPERSRPGLPQDRPALPPADYASTRRTGYSETEAPPPPRKVVTLPPKPPLPQLPVPQPTRSAPSARPAIAQDRPVLPAPEPRRNPTPLPAPRPPLPPQRPQENDDVPRFGRALLDELADFDDEIPSYMPRKSSIKPNTVPLPPPPATPSASRIPTREAGVPARTADGDSAIKKPVAAKPASTPARKSGAAQGPSKPATPGKDSSTQNQKKVEKQSPPPEPVEDDYSEFGAGLDD